MAMDSLPSLWILVLMILEQTLPSQCTYDVTPRITFPYSDPSRTFAKFSKDGYWNYSTLFLGEGKLYVGARDTLFSVDTATVGNMELIKELHWNATEQKVQDCSFKGKSKERDCSNFIRVLLPVNESHIYTCGTYAFSPTCAYIDVRTFSLLTDSNGDPLTEEGKGRCPFDPSLKLTATMVDGELYTGTTNNFQGTQSIISRSLGHRVALKTEPSFNWLQDPIFVGSSFVPDSEGDKVYFFFTETRHKSDLLQRMSLSLVGRVCKSDVGGQRVLQKRWTTFLKAQLLCYLPEDQFPFNVLQDMFVSEDEEGSVFYGVFSSQWFRGVSDSTAVCAFALPDIQEVFNGQYKLLNRETLTWSLFTVDSSEPRPGACNTEPSMDSTLNLVKDLFLMNEAVQPIGKRPQLVNLKEQYIKIAVDTVLSTSSVRHRVMFLITARGLLHKALRVKATSYIIEELQLFPSPRTVHSLVLSADKGLLYIGTSIGVLQVPLSNCSAYLSCGECVLSRDPYCAWDRQDKACKETRNQSNMDTWIQDIEKANANSACTPPLRPRMLGPEATPEEPASPILKTVCSNSLVTLQCQAKSNLARTSWTYKGQDAAAMPGLSSQGPVLSFVATTERQGLWQCWASENQYRALQVSYSLRVSGPAVMVSGEGQQSQMDAAVKTYRSELVLVSVLFGLSGLAVTIFALYSCSQQLRSRRKVRGSGPAEAGGEPAGGLEAVHIRKGPVSNGSSQDLQDGDQAGGSRHS